MRMIHIYTHIYICMHNLRVYIYIERERDMPNSPPSVSQGPFLGFQSVELPQSPPERSADPGFASVASPRPRRS